MPSNWLLRNILVINNIISKYRGLCAITILDSINPHPLSQIKEISVGVVLFSKKSPKAKPRKLSMSGMERLQRMFAGAGGALGHPPPDSPTLDSSEQVYISSLALLKMLKHGKT